MSLYTRWAQKEHPQRRRVAALILIAPLFLIALPILVIAGGRRADRRLGLPRLNFGAANYVAGGLLSAAGMALAQWSIYDQLTRGRGTPLPLLPTQELLVRGPFRYCRNPMTLGTIMAYLGIAIAAGTISGAGLVAFLSGLLILYLKRVEERELAERFGEPYLRYKQDVPFIIPRLTNKQAAESAEPREANERYVSNPVRR